MPSDKDRGTAVPSARIALKAVRQQNKAAYQLAMLLGQCAHAPISPLVLTLGHRALPRPLRRICRSGERSVERVIDLLIEHSLAIRVESGGVQPDPNTAHVLQIFADPLENWPSKLWPFRSNDRWRNVLAGLMLTATSDDSGGRIESDRWQELAPHVARVLDNLAAPSVITAELSHAYATYLFAQGKYDDAYQQFLQFQAWCPVFKRDRKAREIDALTHLAQTLAELGKFEAAKELQEDVVIKWTTLRGKSDEATLKAVGTLAVILGQMGDFAAAEERLTEILDSSLEVPWKDSTAVLALSGALSDILRRRGNPKEACRIYERLLERCRADLGHHSDETLLMMNNLSVAYCDLGDHRKSIQLAREAHKALLDKYGEEHPRTLAALGNWGRALRGSGNLLLAKDVFSREVALRRNSLGPEHPLTRDAIADLKSVDRRRRR